MRRRNFNMWINQFFHRGERQLIRVIILGSVILVILQLSLAKDPVQFYLSMAKEVESPSLEVNSSQKMQMWQITFKATPNLPVRILQNGRELGTLAKGEQVVSVQTGTVQLDAGKVKQPVRVQVIKCDPLLSQPRLNQTFICNGDVQEVRIGP